MGGVGTNLEKSFVWPFPYVLSSDPKTRNPLF
jgi:hypothetical protein